MSTTTKRLLLTLLVVTLFGSACADSTGPRGETCTETQGSGGVVCPK